MVLEFAEMPVDTFIATSAQDVTMNDFDARYLKHSIWSSIANDLYVCVLPFFHSVNL